MSRVPVDTPLYCLRIAPSHDPDGVPGWRSLVVGLLTEPQSGDVSTVGYGKSSRRDDPWGLVPDEAATARALLDSSGRITHWNDGARRLLGHTAARMLGRSAAELLADPVAVTAPSRHERPLPWRGTVELRHRDGRRLTVRLLAHRLRQQEGGFEGWLLVSPLAGTERTEGGQPTAPPGVPLRAQRSRPVRHRNPAAARQPSDGGGHRAHRGGGSRPSPVGDRRQAAEHRAGGAAASGAGKRQAQGCPHPAAYRWRAARACLAGADRPNVGRTGRAGGGRAICC